MSVDNLLAAAAFLQSNAHARKPDSVRSDIWRSAERGETEKCSAYFRASILLDFIGSEALRTSSNHPGHGGKLLMEHSLACSGQLVRATTLDRFQRLDPAQFLQTS